MRNTDRTQSMPSRLASALSAATLSLAISACLLASSAVQARVAPTTDATPATLWQPRQSAQESSIAAQERVIESGALPAPFLVAPTCPKCKNMRAPVGDTDPQAVHPAWEDKALPAPFLVAPTGCGRSGCITEVGRAEDARVLPAPLLVAPSGCGKSGCLREAGHAEDARFLPAPLLVAPSGCGRNGCIREVGPSEEANPSLEIASGDGCGPLPATLRESALCGAHRGGSIDRVATEREPMMLAGGGPPVVVDSRPGPRS
jgi:hypothetical protein